MALIVRLGFGALSSSPPLVANPVMTTEMSVEEAVSMAQSMDTNPRVSCYLEVIRSRRIVVAFPDAQEARVEFEGAIDELRPIWEVLHRHKKPEPKYKQPS